MFKSLLIIWLSQSVMKKRILIGSLGGPKFAIWGTQGWTSNKLIVVKLLLLYSTQISR